MDTSRIIDIRVYEATSSISRAISDATHDISKIAFLVLEVETAGGVTGQGYLLSFHYSEQAVKGALADLVEFTLPRDYKVHETLQVQRDYEAESEYFGIEGLQRWALATLNVAMWDAWGRQLGQPVWRLLGNHNRPIPVYGSGGWLSYTDDELLEEVRGYKARGFRAVKIKVGSSEPGRDIERLRRVRDAVGPELGIMMDANQGMDVPGALELSHAAQPLGIRWFEEPIARDNYEGFATLRHRTQISIAMGEREYNSIGLRELLDRRAIDLWQPDIIRIGGVEAWRESAALAATHGIPVLPHYYKDYDVPLLATVSNAYGAESFDWIDGLIDNQMVIQDGLARPREGAGWGFTFRQELLNEVHMPSSQLTAKAS
ncbi:mandelate racemase/muconate lactonizing enzyme family protein [Tessaracoccus terricola]